MKLSLNHIDSSAFPYQKLAYLELAEQLNPKLMPILLKEISLGNRIFEAGKNNDSQWVSLKYPFKGIHQLPKEVLHREEKDPHYNTSEYVTDDPSPHILSAPLKK